MGGSRKSAFRLRATRQLRRTIGGQRTLSVTPVLDERGDHSGDDREGEYWPTRQVRSMRGNLDYNADQKPQRCPAEHSSERCEQAFTTHQHSPCYRTHNTPRESPQWVARGWSPCDCTWMENGRSLNGQRPKRWPVPRNQRRHSAHFKARSSVDCQTVSEIKLWSGRSHFSGKHAPKSNPHRSHICIQLRGIGCRRISPACATIVGKLNVVSQAR